MVRIRDTKTNKPVLICVPDGPNVIEHYEPLFQALGQDYRMICFELPGFGFSYPSYRYGFSFSSTAAVILQVMDSLKISRASLSFSCANGFCAIAAAKAPERFDHLFLAQTPALHAMKDWVYHIIPKPLTVPYVGQLGMAFLEKKFAHSWYRHALPEGTDKAEYQTTAVHAIKEGACFCLSGIVQGLASEYHKPLLSLQVPATLVWGNKDKTHKRTDFKSILEHLPTCTLVSFDGCGHFPDLEKAE